MGKKSRRKRRKYKYSRNEFMLNVCSICDICLPNTNPTFCFDEMYISNPKRFMDYVLPDLMEKSNELKNINAQGGEDYENFIEFLLEDSFCAYNLCGNGTAGGANCFAKPNCLRGFHEQIANRDGRVINLDAKRKEKKKNNQQIIIRKKKKKIIKIKPMFFCNDSFREEVDRIVNENNIGQQDTSSAST